MKKYDDRQPRIKQLVARSSLGTRAALAARAKTPAEVAEEIVLRAEIRRVDHGGSLHMRSTKNDTANDKSSFGACFACGRSPISEKDSMVYITNIRLSTNGVGHEHIIALKWRNPVDAKTGESSRDEMVKWIRGGGDARVKDGYGEVAVAVVEATPPFVRTVADGRFTDNLLALPRF